MIIFFHKTLDVFQYQSYEMNILQWLNFHLNVFDLKCDKEIPWGIGKQIPEVNKIVGNRKMC